jgi:hypothetical protein
MLRNKGWREGKGRKLCQASPKSSLYFFENVFETVKAEKRVNAIMSNVVKGNSFGDSI